MCPYYFDLEPIMADRALTKPKATSDLLDKTDDDKDKDEDDLRGIDEDDPKDEEMVGLEEKE